MRHIISYLFICFAMTVFACGNEKTYPPATDALDAGREFIDAFLKGDFDKANFYMYKDSANNSLLERQKKSYSEKKDVEKQQYHDASIIINENAVINDSVTIINFQNSYDNIGHKVKVIFKDGTWLVDFKYTFDGNL